MRPTLMFTRVLTVFLLSLCAITGDARAEKPAAPTKEAIRPEPGDVVAPTATLLTTGFEVSEGFVLGPLEPQNGWVATGINSPWASISNQHPATGSQHLRLGVDPGGAWGSTRIALSPQIPLPGNTPSQFRALVYFTGPFGVDYEFVGQSLSEGLITWRLHFSYTPFTGQPTILVVDHLEAEIGYYNSGVPWTFGSYVELKVQHDPAAHEIRYFYGGVLVYTSRLWGGTSVEQIAMVHYNRQSFGDYAGVDAMSLLDTASDPTGARPSSWGALKGLYR